jgi:uncharacterized protein (DUF302 family)
VENQQMPESDCVEHRSASPFAETVDLLVQAIERAGMNLFARIDHAAGARDVGMQMPPTIVLIYGHARGGTPVMQAAPAGALDLPLRVLIRETGDGTVIAFHPVRQMLAQHKVPSELVERLAKAQELLVGAIS